MTQSKLFYKNNTV